jgi:hypothetical protein
MFGKTEKKQRQRPAAARHEKKTGADERVMV